MVSAQTELGKIELEYSETIPNEKGNIMTIAGVKNDSIHVLSRTKKDFFFKLLMPKLKKYHPANLLKFKKTLKLEIM